MPNGDTSMTYPFPYKTMDGIDEGAFFILTGSSNLGILGNGNSYTITPTVTGAGEFVLQTSPYITTPTFNTNFEVNSTGGDTVVFDPSYVTTNYSFFLPQTAGTAGSQLTSAGAGAAMYWAPPSSGGGVSYIGMTVPSFLLVSPGSVSTTGTFAVTLSGSALPLTSGGTGLTSVGTAGTVLTSNGTSMSWTSPATSGTVTSVAVTVPSFLSVGGSPITSSGTISLGLSGSALPLTSGGTGLTSIGGAGTVLTSTGSSASWVAATSGGTVTSVGLSLPSILSVTPSTITSSGVFAVTTATPPSGTGAIILQSNPLIYDLNVENGFNASNGTSIPTTVGEVTTTYAMNVYSESGMTTGNDINILSSTTNITDTADINIQTSGVGIGNISLASLDAVEAGISISAASAGISAVTIDCGAGGVADISLVSAAVGIFGVSSNTMTAAGEGVADIFINSVGVGVSNISITSTSATVSGTIEILANSYVDGIIIIEAAGAGGAGDISLIAAGSDSGSITLTAGLVGVTGTLAMSANGASCSVGISAVGVGGTLYIVGDGALTGVDVRLGNNLAGDVSMYASSGNTKIITGTGDIFMNCPWGAMNLGLNTGIDPYIGDPVGVGAFYLTTTDAHYDPVFVPTPDGHITLSTLGCSGTLANIELQSSRLLGIKSNNSAFTAFISTNYITGTNLLWNLPATCGSLGQLLTSGGGTTNAMTWTGVTGSSGSVALSVNPTFTASSVSSTSNTMTLNNGGSGGTLFGVSLNTYALTGNYTFYFPSTAGIAGYVLMSGGGSGANTWIATTGTGSVARSTIPTFLTYVVVDGVNGGFRAIDSLTAVAANFSVSSSSAAYFATTNWPQDVVGDAVMQTSSGYGLIFGAGGKGLMRISNSGSVTIGGASSGYSIVDGVNAVGVTFAVSSAAGTFFTSGYTDLKGDAIIQSYTTRGLTFGSGTSGLMQLSNAGVLSVSSIDVGGSIIGNSLSLSIPLPIASGGTGLSTIGTAGKVLTSTGTAAVWSSAVTSVGIDTSAAPFLTAGSAVTSSGNITLSYNSTALPVANGGTGVKTSIGTGGNVVLSIGPTFTGASSSVGQLALQQFTNFYNLTQNANYITGPYNWNYPTTAGSTGQILTSGGGGSTAMSWTDVTGTGDVVLSANPTMTGTLTVPIIATALLIAPIISISTSMTVPTLSVTSTPLVVTATAASLKCTDGTSSVFFGVSSTSTSWFTNLAVLGDAVVSLNAGFTLGSGATGLFRVGGAGSITTNLTGSSSIDAFTAYAGSLTSGNFITKHFGYSSGTGLGISEKFTYNSTLANNTYSLGFNSLSNFLSVTEAGAISIGYTGATNTLTGNTTVTGTLNISGATVSTAQIKVNYTNGLFATTDGTYSGGFGISSSASAYFPTGAYFKDSAGDSIIVCATGLTVGTGAYGMFKVTTTGIQHATSGGTKIFSTSSSGNPAATIYGTYANFSMNDGTYTSNRIATNSAANGYCNPSGAGDVVVMTNNGFDVCTPGGGVLQRLDSSGNMTIPGSISALNIVTGSWTPSFYAGPNSATMSGQTVHWARYARCGNAVTVSFYVSGTWSSANISSCYLYCSGLPYTVGYDGTGIGGLNSSMTTGAYNNTWPYLGQAENGYSHISFWTSTGGTNAIPGQCSLTTLGGGYSMQMSITYLI